MLAFDDDDGEPDDLPLLEDEDGDDDDKALMIEMRKLAEQAQHLVDR